MYTRFTPWLQIHDLTVSNLYMYDYITHLNHSIEKVSKNQVTFIQKDWHIHNLIQTFNTHSPYNKYNQIQKHSNPNSDNTELSKPSKKPPNTYIPPTNTTSTKRSESGIVFRQLVNIYHAAWWWPCTGHRASAIIHICMPHGEYTHIFLLPFIAFRLCAERNLEGPWRFAKSSCAPPFFFFHFIPITGKPGWFMVLRFISFFGNEALTLQTICKDHKDPKDNLCQCPY